MNEWSSTSKTPICINGANGEVVLLRFVKTHTNTAGNACVLNVKLDGTCTAVYMYRSVHVPQCMCVCVCGMEINSGKSIYHFDEFHLEQDRQCTYTPDIKVRLFNHCFRGKAINIAYSECVFVTIIMQHAMRMRRVILSSVVCLVLPYFSTLSHKKLQDFRDKILLNIKLVF
jgi:hypothetical protein